MRCVQVVSAAFDAFESDGDIEDLVETLCLIHEHGSSSGSPVPGARSPAASSKPPQASPTSREPADVSVSVVLVGAALSLDVAPFAVVAGRHRICFHLPLTVRKWFRAAG
jgi:hypothetical protein